MIKLWNLNSIYHLHLHGIIINFILLFYLRFGIYLHLVTESCLEGGVNRKVKTFSTKTISKLGKTELISKFTRLTLEMRCSK
jgi:hypothetical protein